MIPSVATAEALLELTHDLERIRRDLQARFTDMGQFEDCLLSEQTHWDDQSLWCASSPCTASRPA
jgi:hypothetical protein